MKSGKDGSSESRRRVVDDHVIGGMTMSCFDQLVSANQIHGIGRETMVLNERMALDNLLDIFRALRLGWFKYFFAIFHAPFDKNRQGGSTHDPMTMVRHLVEPSAVGSAGGQWTDMREVSGAESQSLHHRQEECRMGPPKGKAARVLLINVFGQHASDGGGRILSMNPGKEDGKVSDVDGVLLLKVNLQLLSYEAACGKVLPGPVMLPIHDAEEGFKKSRFRHAGCHSMLPS